MPEEPEPPCTTDLWKMHYTFDYSKHVRIPQFLDRLVLVLPISEKGADLRVMIRWQFSTIQLSKEDISIDGSKTNAMLN